MPDSSLDLLLRVASGGKRARSAAPHVSKDEKLAYMKHQLEVSRSNLKETYLPLHNVLLKHVDDAMERMASKIDGEIIKHSILKMGEAKITALKTEDQSRTTQREGVVSIFTVLLRGSRSLGGVGRIH